jgi:hypothetical protein
MTLDEVDRVEIWFRRWFCRVSTLATWYEVRDQANGLMDRVMVEIEHCRAHC